MSGPKVTRHGQIDLRLSPESKRSLEAYKKSLEATARQVKDLTQDLQNVKKVTDSIKMQTLARGGNFKGYMDGQREMARRQLEGLNRAGSTAGRQVGLQLGESKFAKDVSKAYREGATWAQAVTRSAREQVALARQSSSVQDLKNKKLVAERTLSEALISGDSSRIRNAERLLRVIEAQTRSLREQERASTAAARRKSTIQGNLRGDPELERSQVAKSWRMRQQAISGDGGAGLFQVQGAVLANYAVMGAAIGGITQGIKFAAEFDDALRNLQAIVVVTDQNMGKLKDRFLDVSEATKFSAVEIANAAVTLGQAGFSTQEIDDSIEAIALLATATGTDLAKSVDIATSVLGVFNMESSQMSGVANTLTAAVNGSKLNIDKLTLGLQYAGNTAAQSGVSFEELTASLGAMANAGIRSGSTLGTGMRQILIALQKPSKEFEATLGRLGLSMADVDLKSNGLYGAMQKLRDAGFSSADAIRSFEVRAASAFNALSGNIEDVIRLERSFLNSEAAAKANETQMRSLTNQSKRLAANLGALAYTGLEPLLYLTRDVFSGLSDLVELMRQAPQVVQYTATAAVSLGAAFVGLRLARLGVGLAATALGFTSIRTAATAAAASTSMLGKAMLFTRTLMGPIGAFTTAAILGYQAMQAFGSETARADTTLQQAQTNFDKAAGGAEEYANKLQMVEGKITDLSNRHEILGDNQSLLDLETEKVRSQFLEMGIVLGENVGTVEELVEALKLLRAEVAEEFQIRIGTSADSLEKLIEANRAKQGAVLERGNPYFTQSSNRAFSQAYPDLTSALAARNNPDASLEEIQRARYQAIDTRDVALSDRSQIGVKAYNVAKGLIRELDTLIPLMSSEVSLTRQLNDARREEVEQASKNQNADLGDRVTDFNNAAKPVITGVKAANDQRPATELYAAGMDAENRIRQDYEQIRSDIENRVDLDEEVRQEWLRELGNTMSEVEAETASLAKGAADAAEASAELAAGFREIERARLNGMLDRANSPEQVQSAVSSLRALNDSELANTQSSISNSRRYEGMGDEETRLRYAEAASEWEEENRRLTEVILEKEGEFSKQRIALLEQLGERFAAELSGAEQRTENMLKEAKTDSTVNIASENLSDLNDTSRKEAIKLLDARLREEEISQTEYQTGLTEIENAHAERAREIRDMTVSAVAEIAEENMAQAMAIIADLKVRLGTANAELQSLLEGTNSIGDTYDLATSMNANARLASDGAVQSIQQNPDLNEEERANQIAEEEQRLKAQIQSNDNEARAARNRIMSLQAKNLQTQASELAMDLEEASTLGEREEIREALRANIEAQADQTGQMAQNMAEDTAAGQAMLQATLAEIEGQKRAELMAVEEASQQDKIAEAERTLTLAQTALEETLQLAQDAETLRERNRYLMEATAQVAAVARAGQGLADIRTEVGEGSEEENQVDFDAMMARLNRRMNNIRRARLPTDRSGGPKKKKKKEKEEDPVDELIEDLSGQLEAAKKMVNIGERTGFSFDGTLEKGTKELDKLTGQIRAMNGKLLNGGTLTADEQEKLNKLVEQHGKLTEFIKGEEEEIAQIKWDQGDAMAGLNAFSEQWAQQNLNMNDTLRDGFLNTLSTLKSGMSQFFLDWASGTEKGKDAFKKMAHGISASIARIITDLMAAWVIQKALGWALPGADLSGLGLPTFSMNGAASGGQVRPKARPAAAGGPVRGNLSRDSQTYELMPGEYVMRASAAQAIGRDNLDRMNSMGNRMMSQAPNPEMAKPGKSEDNTVNVWVVPPSTKPSMGPNDVLAVISDDIARGGTTKKLIKSVQMGH